MKLVDMLRFQETRVKIYAIWQFKGKNLNYLSGWCSGDVDWY